MLAKHIFENLIGKWTIHRTLFNIKSNNQLGVVKGIATFQPLSEHELHYSEQGNFIIELSGEYRIKREDIYVYDPLNHCINKYFMENGKKGDLFYNLNFSEIKDEYSLAAKASHQCNRNRYDVHYQFLEGVLFNKFNLTYRVEGPTKHYISETFFER